MDSSYKKLLIAMSINTLLMFLLTYSMIWGLEHFQVNINRIYMALMMAAPMGIIMLLLMPSMFKNRKLNLALFTIFALLFIVTFSFARTQTPVGDTQFLRSMIPHHSSAILMCEQSNITDPEITKLCEEIVKTQKEEIAQMKTILARK